MNRYWSLSPSVQVRLASKRRCVHDGGTFCFSSSPKPDHHLHGGVLRVILAYAVALSVGRLALYSAFANNGEARDIRLRLRSLPEHVLSHVLNRKEKQHRRRPRKLPALRNSVARPTGQRLTRLEFSSKARLNACVDIIYVPCFDVRHGTVLVCLFRVVSSN